jgi:hypothetical protein
VPSPSSAFASPPPTLASASAPAPEHALRLVASTDAPGAACGVSCRRTWSECGARCDAGACRAACDERYRGCMRACF